MNTFIDNRLFGTVGIDVFIYIILYEKTCCEFYYYCIVYPSYLNKQGER